MILHALIFRNSFRSELAPSVFLVLVLSAGLFAQSPEPAALGGPCAAEPMGPGWHQLVSRYTQEIKSGNKHEAIELAKQIVRGSCSNEYWWIKLASSLAELNRMTESVAVLDALYARKSNTIDAELRKPDSPLRKLAGSEAFRKSALAMNLRKDRRELYKRRTAAEARFTNQRHPPGQYVAKKACPFECCGFGTWSVAKDTALFDSPGGTQAVGRAPKGEKVEALTGEVHLSPIPVVVRHGANPGSIVFLLDNLGEGFAHIWINGKVTEAEIIGVQEECTFPGPTCWGEFLHPEDADRKREDAVWWIRIKTRNGIIGWTKQADHFGGMDRCG